MIEVQCICHYDKYKFAKWPCKFAALPRIGDLVEPVTGQEPLRVAEITHCAGPLVKLLLMTDSGIVPS